MSRQQFPLHGWLGICIILSAEVLLFANVVLVGLYFTPIVWSGYILFIDGLNFKIKGNSLIKTRRREFFMMLPWSVLCWLIFEAYNLYLQNWSYIGLPSNIVLRCIGYAWAFATIFPAVLETAELVESFISKPSQSTTYLRKRAFIISVSIGLILLIIPVIVKQEIAGKLFALIWIGFIFVLDPINERFKGNSILKQLKQRNYSTIIALTLSGLICGILWEFWNYWATAKWVYNIPISFVGPKVFEMPLLGYLGFIPFAFEIYVMHEFLVLLFPSIRKKN